LAVEIGRIKNKMAMRKKGMPLPRRGEENAVVFEAA
jgi:hypothetical protein